MVFLNKGSVHEKKTEKLQALSQAAGKMFVYLEGLSKRGGPPLFNDLI